MMPVPKLQRSEPLRSELSRVLPERPFTLRFWDGGELPATAPNGLVFSLRSPAAVGHVLRAPSQLGLGRASTSAGRSR